MTPQGGLSLEEVCHLIPSLRPRPVPMPWDQPTPSQDNEVARQRAQRKIDNAFRNRDRRRREHQSAREAS